MSALGAWLLEAAGTVPSWRMDAIGFLLVVLALIFLGLSWAVTK